MYDYIIGKLVSKNAASKDKTITVECNNIGYLINFNERNLQKIGKDIILLCYETPEKFCHRHSVAKWLNEKLNLNI